MKVTSKKGTINFKPPKPFHVTAGIHSDAGVHPTAGLPIVQLGEIHEYSKRHPRSWLRGWFDENRPQLEAWLVQFAHNPAALALKLEASIKARVAAGIPPPLKRETIRRKGSSKPLIDTGVLLSKITARVNQ